ncbi:hypothetical protein POM88_001587 [Heracleum sosnowskyi]|uniref:F-box associated beta-propeller type 1 domain-containing protein n=1 Tax=Heracleum sosnowskyi TaxID=360622 RepID=A0AAD8GM98_9APIA|nr:hypothetical protein POM88_055080 [Heracleum sosnowskyi]KAK1401982.1 hypothetical protein POM88_001587 [Heracleum sosnowskyi]
MYDRGNRTKKTTKQQIVEFRQEINQMSLIDVVSESLIARIIAGFPIASICVFRCVCKLFLKLISEKFFTKFYTEMSPYTTIVFNNNFGIHLVEIAKGYCRSYKSIIPIRNAKIVGSCKGLICFLRLYGGVAYFPCLQPILYICNPILGQYTILPKPNNKYGSKRQIKEVYGFGFSSSTDHYKILRISTLIHPMHPIYKKRSEAEVLIVGINTWKSIGYLPYPSNQESLDVIVKGAFHWLFYNEMEDFTSLYAFKIEEERDYQIPFPSGIGKGKVNMSIGVLNNCLCLFDNSGLTHFGIWSMQKYEVGESWALNCILTTSIPAGLDTSSLHLVAVLKDDGILVKLRNGNFYIYDQKKKNFTRLVIDNVELWADFNCHAVHSSNFYPLDLISTGCLIDHKW